jgi:hypothetical protein
MKSNADRVIRVRRPMCQGVAAIKDKPVILRHIK